MWVGVTILLVLWRSNLWILKPLTSIAYLMDTYGEACNNLILSFRPQYCHSSSFYHFNLRPWDQCLTHSGIGHLWGSLQQTLSIIPTSFLAPLKSVGSLQPDLAHLYVWPMHQHAHHHHSHRQKVSVLHPDLPLVCWTPITALTPSSQSLSKSVTSSPPDLGLVWPL